MKLIPLPSKERLDELLSFDPDTGEIRWKVGRGNSKVGNIAGSIWTYPKTGMKYFRIQIDGILYLAHRLAHYYYTGDQSLMVDHKNGKGLDNRKENLRSANYKLNSNNRGMSKNNTSGVTGVYYDKRKKLWRAEFGDFEFSKLNKTRKKFKDFFEAVCQRKMWEDKFGMTEAKKHRGS